jgi:LPS-assembly protein
MQIRTLEIKTPCRNATLKAGSRRPSGFSFRPVYGLFLLLLCLPFGPAPASGADVSAYERLFVGDPESPWQLSANSVSYDAKARQYRASGHVVIRQVDKTLSADHVAFNAASMQMSARGHVTLKVGEDVLNAGRMEINLRQDRGILYDGDVFLEQNHFRIAGDKVEQTSRYAYTIENAVVTTCDGQSPAWKITGKKVDVTLNGYGFVRHGVLWARQVPVFYMPWLVFPAKLDRQSGLLMPKMGFSERKGMEYDQPFYWAVNQSSDVTLYDHYMSERGNKIGLEYRYVVDDQSRGALMADFLEDREIDDGFASSTNHWGYDHDAQIRTNTDRYWLRMKLDQILGNGFSAKLDADIVSDQDFLIEFREGNSGYNTTSSYFLKSFGRMPDAYEDPTRVNRLNVARIGSFYSFNTDVKWYDDIVARRWEDDDATLQNLPQMKFNTLRQQIYDTLFYWDMASEYTYFYSKDGSSGHRMDVHPKLYMPAYRSRYLSLEPSMGFRQTGWQIDTFQDHPLEAGKDKTKFRYLYDARLSLSSEAYRIYAVDGSRIDAVKHTLLPQIVYDFIPEVNQDKYPWFEDLDDDTNRVDPTNRISLVLTNLWTTRSKAPAPSQKGEKNPDIAGVHIDPLLRFELIQGYDIFEANANRPADYRNEKDKQPFLPLEADLEFTYADFFSAAADAQWNHYDGNFYARNIAFGVRSAEGRRLYVDYRFTEDLVESLGADIGVVLGEYFFPYAGYHRNLSESKTLETTLGLLYEAQCFSLDLRLKEEEDDRSVQFMVNFKGLGEIGSQ